MKFPFGKAVWAAACLWAQAALAQSTNFMNFETAPVHPVALSPDHKTLAVCNLPDNTVELFDITQGAPKRVGIVFTGLDPVAARFRTDGELWVVNHISDSISVIDVSRRVVTATLDTFDAPADVVFTTNPSRAYVSHAGANLVEIWDAEQQTSLNSVDIDGDRPKAMAASADGSEIYIAILESGNGSTIIAPELTELDRTPPFAANELPESPQRGLNPFPNLGDLFDPIINPAIPSTNPPPRVGVIVRKQHGRWMDDNHGDWTEYISGTNAFLTGRVPGWDTADHDLAIINTKSNTVRYVRGLMNICFDVAVNPASGKIAVIGTDAINEVRFEPNLKSIFVRAKLAQFDPTTHTANVTDLNPHLDYIKRQIPLEERKLSAGDPRGIAWNSRGDRAYVTGMGSNNLLMIDADGNRLATAVDLPDGPTGLVVDDQRNRIYVLCRFASRLITVDADTLKIISNVPMHDSTPDEIRIGRKHFYNTVDNSGLGQVSCASCHIDGRFDRLAWDLGDQTGSMLAFTNRNLIATPARTNDFHPMKGPMVTQTLQDIIGHEPFHWRGDRDGIEKFSPTFMSLQGREEEHTPAEIQEFKAFLATIAFPPNPFRNLNNSLATSLDVSPARTFGRGARPSGQPFPNGNAVRGLALFRSPSAPACNSCHSLPTGLGPDSIFQARWKTIATGTNAEHHVAMVAQQRTSGLPFKIQQLRNLGDKVGFDLRGPVSRSGFGFFHDGRVDTLARFLQDGFSVNGDQDCADMMAFLLSFTGSDLPAGVITDVNQPPGLPSRDVSAGVGFQSIQTNAVAPDRLQFMLNAIRPSTSRVDLIVHGFKDGVPRAWLVRASDSMFISDKNAETNSLSEALAFATPETPMIFTLAARGSGVRMALDADGDGFFNQTEIEAAADPNDASITPDTATPRLESFRFDSGQVRIAWFGKMGNAYRVQSRDAFDATSGWADHSEAITIATNPAAWAEALDPSAAARFYRIIQVP